jgi:hypothetical protein
VGEAAVADGITLGGIVGSGVDLATGISAPAQAERSNKRIEMSFFIMTICHCEPAGSNLLLNDEFLSMGFCQ